MVRTWVSPTRFGLTAVKMLWRTWSPVTSKRPA
jgi:hypothetical protein